MPTNIVQASGKPVEESGWSSIGRGAGQLAQLVGGLMQANAAKKAAEVAPAKEILAAHNAANPNPSLSPFGTPEPTMSTPGAMGAFTGGAGSGNLGMASLPSRPIDGMVQPFNSAPRGEFLSVGPSSQPAPLVSPFMPGIARTFSPLQTMMTRNFPAGTFQYGGL